MADKYYCNATTVPWQTLDALGCYCSSSSGTTLGFFSNGPTTAYNGLGATIWYYSGGWLQVKTSGGVAITLTTGSAARTTATISATPSVSLLGQNLYFCATTTAPVSTDNVFYTSSYGYGTIPVTSLSCVNLTATVSVGSSTSTYSVSGNLVSNTAINGTVTMSGSSATLSLLGSNVSLSVIITGNVTQAANSNIGSLIVSTGGTYSNSTYNILPVNSTATTKGINVSGGTFNLNSSINLFNSGTYQFNVSSGTLNLNSYTLSIDNFTVTGSPTINAGTSTIRLSAQFTGAGKTFYNLLMDMEQSASSGTGLGPIIVDSCTFNNISNTGISPTSNNVISLGTNGATITASSFNISGSPVSDLQIYDQISTTTPLPTYNVVKAGGGSVKMIAVEIGGMHASGGSFIAYNSPYLILDPTYYGTTTGVSNGGTLTTKTVIFRAAGAVYSGTYTIPTDFFALQQIEAIGAGGGSVAGSGSMVSGGLGGAYTASYAVQGLASGVVLSWQAGSSNNPSASALNSWLVNNSSGVAPTSNLSGVLAFGGSDNTTSNVFQVSGCIGNLAYAGGPGGSPYAGLSCGGGGSAGSPAGAGAAGGPGATYGGSGGGGAGIISGIYNQGNAGSYSGVGGSSGYGTAGGGAYSGVGVSGSGGGGSYSTYGGGGNGGGYSSANPTYYMWMDNSGGPNNGLKITPGGGGGGGNPNFNGGSGGFYGGAGGGSGVASPNYGGFGALIFTYYVTPAFNGHTTFFMAF
jgi:hypothetical protein